MTHGCVGTASAAAVTSPIMSRVVLCFPLYIYGTRCVRRWRVRSSGAPCEAEARVGVRDCRRKTPLSHLHMHILGAHIDIHALIRGSTSTCTIGALKKPLIWLVSIRAK